MQSGLIRYYFSTLFELEPVFAEKAGKTGGSAPPRASGDFHIRVRHPHGGPESVMKGQPSQTFRKTPMDLFSAIHSFIRVAETGSFSVTSRELHVSQPTISRQIHFLENHYGIRLFSRTTRCLTLTDDGQTLLEHAQSIHSILHDAHLALSQRQSRVYGHIRLGTPTAFGLYLTPRLDALTRQHPELSIELVVSDSFGDIVKEGLDVAIRVGTGHAGSTITRHFTDVERVLVGAPDFFDSHPLPTHPNDLIGLSPVVYTYGAQDPDWTFTRGNQRLSLPMHSSFKTNNSEVVHRAVAKGMGVGLIPLYAVHADLKAGRLVHLLPDWQVPKLDLHVVYPGPQNACLRRRTVLHFLLSLLPELSSLTVPAIAEMQ